jgi:hypothetical protein
MDHLPSLLKIATQTLESDCPEPSAEGMEFAAKHGAIRKGQGYTAPMIVREAGILHNALTRIIQECLLEIDLSTVIGDVMKIGETLNALMEESLYGFEKVVQL